eukprot:EG_transcript_2153
MAHYFDWCPEAVVLLHAATHRILKGNRFFHHGVGPLASVAGQHVLDALFCTADRDRMAQALLEAEHAQVAITVLDCATSVWGPGPPLTRRFDWVVAPHGRTIVLSGRLTAGTAACAAPPLPMGPSLWDDDTDALNTTGTDGGEQASSALECPTAEVSPRCCMKPDAESILEGRRRCFAQTDVARKIQEARQFAELKAYGELLRQKDAFVERIFHEIRTPCHTLQMITQSLVDQLPSDSDLKGQLEMAWAQGVHICQLADDVKRAMLLQAGQPPPLQRVWVPLSSVVNASQGFVQRLFPKGDVTLQVQCDNSISPDLNVFVDIDLLSTVLCHLLANALKFTDNGCVTLELRSDGAGHVTFSVSNPGPQLSEEAIRQLGQKYWQDPGISARTNLEENHTGCGLGLHISFHYVRLMGGQLQVQSTPAATTFWFNIETEVVRHRDSASSDTGMEGAATQSNFIAASTSSLWSGWLQQGSSWDTSSSQATPSHRQTLLDTHLRASFSLATASPKGPRRSLPEPLPSVEAGAKKAKRRCVWSCLVPWGKKSGSPAHAEKPAAPSTIPPCHPTKSPLMPRVLVVEDNVVCQKVVCRCLDQAGLTYAVAPNGKVACDLVAANPAGFDVVLMDLRMPVMDGIAATQRLRQQLRCTLPIVVFSAEVGEATLEQVALAGATDLLPKPATPRMVLDMIYKHCPSHPR